MGDAAPIKDASEKWRLLPSFFKTRSLVHHHLNSYNHFVDVTMKKIVRANSEIRLANDPTFFFRYTNVYIAADGPTVDSGLVSERITPQQCRLRDMTYSANIKVDVRYVRGNQMVQSKGVKIGKLPVMLRSKICRLAGRSESELAQMGECPHDPGGYFVCKGVEKVLLIQEQLSKNRIIIEREAKGDLSATVTSSTHERKSRCSVVFSKAAFYLRHNTFTSDIPFVVVMKAIGVATDQEIIQMVGSDAKYSAMLASSLEEASRLKVHSSFTALRYIASQMKQRLYATDRSPAEEAEDTLRDVILNHVPVKDGNFRPKVIYMCSMVRRLVMAHRGDVALDDKDNYGNKRLELSGDLLALLFEDLFKRINSDVQRQAEQMLNKANKGTFDAVKVLQSRAMTDGFVHAISSGNWTIKRFRMERSGVTQVLSRLSYISALGMMTRMQSQFEKTRKVSGPRSLHPSTFGMLCPADTPEGESCGLVKNLALMCHVTTDAEPGPIRRLAYNLGVEDCEILHGDEINHNWIVFLNGEILGVHRRPVFFATQVRWFRRHGFIGQYVSIYVNEQLRAVYLAADGGRVCRPLVVVDPDTHLSRLTREDVDQVEAGRVSFDELVTSGKLEYVDVNEENNCHVAFQDTSIEPHTTHVEIDPLTVLGVCAGLIPYPHHNQSPRNTYQW